MTLGEEVSTCLAESRTVNTPASSGRVPACLGGLGSVAAFLGVTILPLLCSGPVDVISIYNRPRHYRYRAGDLEDLLKSQSWGGDIENLFQGRSPV